MNPFAQKIGELVDKTSTNKAVLKKAQHRHKHMRLRTEKNSKLYRDTSNERYKARADKFSAKSQYWLGRIKKQLNRIEFLDDKLREVKKESEKWRKENAVAVKRHKNGSIYITGRDKRKKLHLALETALHEYGHGSYYSQTGAPRAYSWALGHMPRGHIWDCSTFADGTYICCRIPAPSGPNTASVGGYTGTEGEHGKKIHESQAQVGDLILYGPFPHHHVEVVLDPKRKLTVGHGDPQVNLGTFDLFGDGDFICRTYIV